MPRFIVFLLVLLGSFSARGAVGLNESALTRQLKTNETALAWRTALGITDGQTNLNATRIYRSSGVVTHTGDTNETTLFTCIIPGGTIGSNGVVRATITYTNSSNNSNVKTYRLKYGSTVVQTIAGASVGYAHWQRDIINLSATSQIVSFSDGNNSSFSVASGTPMSHAVNTANDVILTVTAQLAVTTDTMGLVQCLIEVLRGNNDPVSDAISVLSYTSMANSLLKDTNAIFPDFIYAVVGREANIYWDALTFDWRRFDYKFLTASLLGANQNERFTIVPTLATTNDTITFNYYDHENQNTLKGLNSILKVAATNAGSGTTQSMVFIGDSLLAAAFYTGELLTLQSNDTYKINLIGTRGSGANKHEGVAGWTFAKHSTNNTSAFVATNTTVFDFNYFLTNNAFATPDWVFLNLGVNDTFNQQNDANAITNATFIRTNYIDRMITSIKADGRSAIKIGVCITTPPANDQDPFGANYTTAMWFTRYKRNWYYFAKMLNDNYAGQQASRVYLVPIHLNLDTYYNFPFQGATAVNSRNTATVNRHSNAVHPDVSGYNQIADSIWAFLKCQF